MNAPERQTALVTGASSGIGRAIAEAFAADGIDLVLTARSQPALDELRTEWTRTYGIRVTTVATDLSVPGAAQGLFETVQGRGIAIDYLVNNAGVGVFGEFVGASLEAELAMSQLNMLAPTVLCKRFLPQLIERRGKIMNVSSLAAFQPGPFMAVYYATKAYLLSLSDALATELAHTGVTVTTFCPGPTSSGFQDKAAMQDSKLVKGKTLATAAGVGMAGYRAMMRGDRVMVPGAMNKIMAFAVRFIPRRALGRMVMAMSAPA
ncbi:hypothetical protein FHW69_003517 [Luteibacter sp. Sphag1AF]|uniref:SDR family NAD(P)-dependent oxidoreductase n=1 Tax=Luteibacter sp. Sphag1AF TaxID=2587031 RepID=UPI001621D95E|nr:SDR family oxidoreductase [Luteibacter sp. Sphag1AF]MBB3228872.1 hypothetical protein [Luteibacter sp. Sphag1AF]